MKKIILTHVLCIIVSLNYISAQQKTPIKATGPYVDRAAPVFNSAMNLQITTSEKRVVEVDYNFKSNQVFRSGLAGLKVIARNDQGVPQWFGGNLVTTKSPSLEASTKAWFQATSALQGLDRSNTFTKKQEWQDDLGQTHVKFDQRHNGIKVFDGEVILHAEGNEVIMQNGNVVSSELLPLSKSANISEAAAKQVIVAHTPSYKKEWNPLAKMGIGKDKNQWEGELVYYKVDGAYRLAYNYVLFANMAERNEYLIDAQDGTILAKWSTICQMHNHDDHHDHSDCSHAKKTILPPPDGPATAVARDLLNINRNLNTYEVSNNFFMIDGSRDMFRANASELPDEPIGAIWTIDIGGQSPVNGNASFSQIFSSNNSWNSSPEGVSAHYNAGQAYEYFKNVHGRNSITGDGQTIVSIVNVTDEDGSSLGNAFYNSLAIWYGNGDNTFFPLGRALDVAGHELSHGVVENSANLVYQNEPGAMNESFADIFGAMIDRDDWLIGEDVVRPGAFPGGALRSISDPHNGAQTGDFGRGWQPRHMNERYTGSEDNGGVHLNSGIPNYAFFLFASQVGRERAEKVFYRALTSYLTRSSGFKELRYAVEQAAGDLYDQTIVNAASQAFFDVGIGEGAPSDFERDIEVNEGADLLMASSAEQGEIYIFDLASGENVFGAPLSTTSHQSKPSITDNGSRIVFVDNMNHIRVIDIDWSTNPPATDERVVSNEAVWRNAVISKDGNKIALLEIVEGDGEDNNILVIDLPSDSQDQFELFNPSYTQGVQTGDVVYADAMEFDLTGNTLMYDALNQIESTLGTNNIEYWDIGFLEVWNPRIDSWPITTQIDKLFGSLPENISIGNPTWSKNSPYIIAFDVIEETALGGFNNSIQGMNIETYDQSRVTDNQILAYPNFSRLDDVMVFDFVNDSNVEGIGAIQLNEDKISAASSPSSLGEGLRWASWFTTGTRIISDVEEIIEDASALTLRPVPAKDNLIITLEDTHMQGKVQIEVSNLQGVKYMNESTISTALTDYKFSVAELPTGSYILTIRSEEKVVSKKFVKI